MGWRRLCSCLWGWQRPRPQPEEEQQPSARPTSEIGAPVAVPVEQCRSSQPAPEPGLTETKPLPRWLRRQLQRRRRSSGPQLLAAYRRMRVEIASLKAQGERTHAQLAALQGQLTELGDALQMVQAHVQQVARPTAVGEGPEQVQEEGGCSNGVGGQEEEEGEDAELKELVWSAASDGSGATTASPAPDIEADDACHRTRVVTPAAPRAPTPDGNVRLIARPLSPPPPPNGPAPFVPLRNGGGVDDEGAPALLQAHPPCSTASSPPANGGDNESAPPQPQEKRLIAGPSSPPPMALPGLIAAPTAQKRALRRPVPMMPPGLQQQQQQQQQEEEEEEEEEQAPPFNVKLYVLRSNAGQLSQQPSSTPPNEGPWAIVAQGPEQGGGFELPPSALVAQGPGGDSVRMRSGAELEGRCRAMLPRLVNGPFPSTVEEATKTWVYFFHGTKNYRGKDIELRIDSNWRLGSASIGAFGKIFFVGEAQGFTEDMVIKAIPLCSSDHGRQSMMDLYVWSSLREVWFHDFLAKHYSWVLPLKGADVMDGHVLLYMTPAEKGSLDRLCGRLDEPALKYVWQWLLTAQILLRQVGLMHADIKPANVLMDAEGRLYLTDFGVMQILDGDGRANMWCGTYRAPEVDAVRYHSGLSYGPPADLWSIGASLMNMMDPGCVFSDECRALLERLMSHNPEERPGISDPDTRRFLGLDDPDAEPVLRIPSPPPSFVARVGMMTGLGEVPAQPQVAFASPVLSSEEDGEVSELDVMPSGGPGEGEQLQGLQRLQGQAEMACLPPGLLDEDWEEYL